MGDVNVIPWQARKVGYDLIAGELNHGVPGWIAAVSRQVRSR